MSQTETVKRQMTGQLRSEDFRKRRKGTRKSYFSPMHNDQHAEPPKPIKKAQLYGGFGGLLVCNYYSTIRQQEAERKLKQDLDNFAPPLGSEEYSEWLAQRVGKKFNFQPIQRPKSSIVIQPLFRQPSRNQALTKSSTVRRKSIFLRKDNKAMKVSDVSQPSKAESQKITVTKVLSESSCKDEDNESVEVSEPTTPKKVFVVKKSLLAKRLQKTLNQNVPESQRGLEQSEMESSSYTSGGSKNESIEDWRPKVKEDLSSKPVSFAATWRDDDIIKNPNYYLSTVERMQIKFTREFLDPKTKYSRRLESSIAECQQHRSIESGTPRNTQPQTVPTTAHQLSLMLSDAQTINTDAAKQCFSNAMGQALSNALGAAIRKREQAEGQVQRPGTSTGIRGKQQATPIIQTDTLEVSSAATNSSRQRPQQRPQTAVGHHNGSRAQRNNVFLTEKLQSRQAKANSPRMSARNLQN